MSGAGGDAAPLVPAPAPRPAALLEDEEPLVVGRAPLRGWSLLVLCVAALGAAALVAGGLVLSGAGVGGVGAARGCRGTIAGGLALLAAGGLACGLARAISDMRTWHETWWDLSRLVVAGLAPGVVLALSAPATLGCRRGLHMADMPLVGDALTGAPALALAAASAALVGAAVASVVRVRIPAPVVAEAWQAGLDEAATPPDPVDALLERADRLDPGIDA